MIRDMAKKIYPTPMIDLGKYDEIGVVSMSVTYCQPIDDHQDGDSELDTQTLTIEACDSPALIGSDQIDSGEEKDGFYYVIKTDRWAIDDTKDLNMLLEDFKLKLRTAITDKKEKEEE